MAADCTECAVEVSRAGGGGGPVLRAGGGGGTEPRAGVTGFREPGKGGGTPKICGLSSSSSGVFGGRGGGGGPGVGVAPESALDRFGEEEEAASDANLPAPENTGTLKVE